MKRSISEQEQNSASLLKGAPHYFAVFRKMVGWQLHLFIALTILGVLIESVGIVLFFPLLNAIEPGGIQSNVDDRMGQFVVAGFDLIGLRPTLEPILILICLVFALRGIVDFVRKLILCWIGPAIQENLRIRVLHGLEKIKYSYFSSLEGGHLTNLVTQEIPRTATAFARYAETITRVLTVGTYFFVSLTLSLRMTLVAMIFGLPFFYFLRSYSTEAKETSRGLTSLNERVSSLILQIFQAFKYLKATHTFNRLGNQAETTILKLRNLSRRYGRIAILPQTFIEPGVVFLICGLIYLEVKIHGRPLASILLSLVLFQKLLTSLIGLQNLWQGFCGTAGSVDRVQKWFDDIERNQENILGLPSTGLHHEIQIQNLAFAYGTKPIFEGLNFTIRAKTTVAFVGLSGGGKTTLADLLLGLLRPTGGRIRVDGQDLNETDMTSWRSRIGYVPQDCVIFNASAEKNISLWDSSRPESQVLEAVKSAARASHAESFIQEMPGKYEENLGERGIRLSGGQRQRLAIAREFYRKPDLFILDEATSALDSESEYLVQSNIDELKGKATIILIAHRLSTIKKADRIYVLSNGKIVEQGAFHELIDRPDSAFRQMCERQQLL